MKEPKKFISVIVILVFAINVLASWLDKTLNNAVASSLLSTGAVSTLVYLLYLAWEHLIWRKEPFAKWISMAAGFYHYPVLAGTWRVQYVSSYETAPGQRATGEGEATIRQTYMNLHIDGRFSESSKFYSFFAALKQKENGLWFLVYTYTNTPIDISLTQSPHGGMHQGFCYLEICDHNRLEGFYSNDENRQTRGKFVLTRNVT